MKVLRRVLIDIGATKGKIIDRYICNRCKSIIKESVNGEKVNKKRVYSRVIFVETNECKYCKSK